MTLLEAVLLIYCRHHTFACEAVVHEHAPRIADLAGAYGVDPVLAVAVCAQESRVGTVRAQSVCGTPHRANDADADTTIAMDALSGHHHRCQSWDGALRMYHYGRGCESADPDGYVHQVRMIERRIRCAMRTGRRC